MGNHNIFVFQQANEIAVIILQCLICFLFDSLNQVDPLLSNMYYDCHNCPLCRYVATAVTSVHHEMENGFNIWSFNGKLLYRILKDHFFQVRSIIVLSESRFYFGSEN